MSPISVEDAQQVLVPFKLPVRRFFWLPLTIAVVLAVAVSGALLFVSWHALSRIEPLRTHLEQTGDLRDVAVHMEELLFLGLRRGEEVSPEQLAALHGVLGALSSNGHYLHARTPSRLRRVEALLESGPAKPADALFEALTELRSALADERRLLGLLMDRLACDTRTEMDLSVLLVGMLPLLGLAALFMLRQRVRQPLESLGDLLARLAERDYRPISNVAVAESATMLQPVFRSYNDLVHRLRKLETEHVDREHTLEQEVRRATGALLTQSRQLARSERLAAVGAVSAGLAHELRNPLAGIQMACAKLQRVLADTDQSARLEAVIAELKRLNRLLTERLEAARHAPESLTQVALKATVQELVSLIRYQIPEGIRLRPRIEETFVRPLPDGSLRPRKGWKRSVPDCASRSMAR